MAAVDLRRRRRRDLVEQVMKRIPELPADDEALMRGVFQHGMTVARVTDLLRGMGRAVEADTVSKRVRRITRRVLSERFEFVVSNRDRWPPTMRRVATCCVLHGRGVRQASRELGLSRHLTRKNLETVEAMYQTAKA